MALTWTMMADPKGASYQLLSGDVASARRRIYLKNHHVGRAEGVAGRIREVLARQILNNGVLNHCRVLRVGIRHGLSGSFASGIVHQLAQHEVTAIIIDGQGQH